MMRCRAGAGDRAGGFGGTRDQATGTVLRVLGRMPAGMGANRRAWGGANGRRPRHGSARNARVNRRITDHTPMFISVRVAPGAGLGGPQRGACVGLGGESRRQCAARPQRPPRAVTVAERGPRGPAHRLRSLSSATQDSISIGRRASFQSQSNRSSKSPAPC